MEYVQEGEDKLLRHSALAVERASSLWDPVGYRLLDRTYCGRTLCRYVSVFMRGCFLEKMLLCLFNTPLL